MSPPPKALRAETGLRFMKYRIRSEKINPVPPIRRMEGGLAKEVYESPGPEELIGMF